MRHFFDPHHTAALPWVSGEGCAGSPESGVYMRMQIQVEDGAVIASRASTFGCVPAIAAGSMIGDWVRGRTLDDARTLEVPTLINLLGGLPPDRHFVAGLAMDALRAALDDAVRRAVTA